MSLISKQIDELRAYAKGRKGELAKLINDAAFTIELLSAKQPEPHWIPCDKGEPNEDMECWVTVKTTDTLYRGNFTRRYGERRDKRLHHKRRLYVVEHGTCMDADLRARTVQ